MLVQSWLLVEKKEFKEKSLVSVLQSSGRTITACEFVCLSKNTFCHVCVSVFLYIFFFL